jgi:methyltransferase (TIGR00027 family)
MKNRPSLTALGIALMRAIESSRPEDERLVYDPYARHFISPILWLAGRFFVRSGYSERRGPGVTGFLAARERIIDDTLRQALAEGACQVVLLGAGYDTRPYRMPELKSVPVFEVDHPATQEHKRRRLQAILPAIPPNVTFVPIDFNQQSLAGSVLPAGCSRKEKTVFIWQGVIYYLDPDAVDSTLQFITNHFPAGSRLVFDYALQSHLDSPQGEVRSTNRYGRFTGERLRYAIPDGGLEAFLQARGFRLLVDYRAADLHRMYFTGKRSRRTISPGYAVAVAGVAHR